MEGFKKLFSPGRIGTMHIRNRIIMSPIGSPFSTPDGYPTDQEIALWEARAKGGVGLIYKTAWAFSPSFGPVFFPGHFDISDDKHIERAERFTRVIKANGAKVACMISHPGKNLAMRRPDLNVVAPSAIRDSLSGAMPRELPKDEISEFVEEYAEAAVRGKRAGFEGVMFQGAHGYLIHQFLSPRTNRRTDEYGGSVINRARFACEIIKRTVEKVGRDFPVVFRMSGDDHFEGGIRIDEAIQQAVLFVEAGVSALDVSSGPRESDHWQFITYIQEDGALVNLATAIKKVVQVPVCTVGKITPLLAERILEEEAVDFVDFARSLLADPEWPNKVKEGKLEDIRPCIYCNQCRVRDRSLKSGKTGPFCAVNPAMGREQEYAREMQPVTSAKKIMVIGGGLAGMEAARTLAERGHEVSLYERSSKLGGQWNIVTAYRTDQIQLLNYLQRGLGNSGVKVFLNQEVTPQTVQEIKPDSVVLAVGAEPAKLDMPDSSSWNVVLAVDVLSGKIDVGQEVVIVGGRGVGLDAAIFLAKQGKKVSVIEMSKIAWGLLPATRLSYWESLINYGVYTYPDTVIDSITNNGVNVLCDGELMFLKADTVVLAVGYKSNSELAEQLKGLVPEVYAVGDCVEPRDILAAINEASEVGRII